MANTYKDIVITPYRSDDTYDPKIQFAGGNTTANTDIHLFVYPTSNGTLSFEGTAGQLFSITNDLSNNLFGVNDVSGIPLIEAYANGLITIAPYYGNVVIGTATGGTSLKNIYKTTVINFGNTVPSYGNTFSVSDAAAISTSKIMAFVSADNEGNTSVLANDELEMDSFNVHASCQTNGTITMHITPNPGPVMGFRTVYYQVT